MKVIYFCIIIFYSTIATNAQSNECYIDSPTTEKEIQKAIFFYTGLISSNSPEKCLPNAYFNRGHCKGRVADYRGAILDLSKFIEIVESDKEKYRSNLLLLSLAYYMKGLSYVSLGYTNEACVNFSKAGELGEEKAFKSIKEYCN